MISIDKLCYQSNLRRINPHQKMLYAIVTLFICVGSRSMLVASLVLLINTVLIVEKSGVPFSRYLHYLKIPVAFMLLSTLSIIVNISAQPMNAFAIPIGNVYLTSSISLLWFALQIMMVAMASVTCLYFLSFTTTMPDIMMVLQSWHMPSLIVELMMLIYRYIFVLLEIASQITLAQQSRLGNHNYKMALQSFGQMVSVLFIRAMQKSNALYDAMESRGYDGRIQVLQEYNPAKRIVTIGIIGVELLYIIVAIIEKTGGVR